MKTIAVVFALWAVLAGAGSLRAMHDGHDEGPTDRNFKVSKTGEVNVAIDVKVGDQIVRRGKYVLTHEVMENRHAFVLVQVDKKKAASELYTIRFDTRFAPSKETVRNSVVFAREQPDHRNYEIAKIQVAGENGDHVVTTSEEAMRIH